MMGRLGFGLGPGNTASSGGSSGPITTLPQQAGTIFDINPDSISPTSGSEVTSFTDSIGAITGTAPSGSGPTWVSNVANGHAVLRTTARSKYLNFGRPAALATPMADSGNWAMMIVFRNANGVDTATGTMFGDIQTSIGGAGFALGASLSGVKAGSSASVLRTFAAADPNTNIHTLIYSGDNGASTGGGRQFLDGTMFQGAVAKKIGPNSDSLYLFNALQATGGAVQTFTGFQGDILRVIIWNTKLSAPEAWQADCWARNTYGKTLATVGLTFFTVLDGDSQTNGTGATPDTSMPALVAASLGLINGQFANVGKPSATMAAGSSFGNNLTDSAARDVDGFRTVTGLPIVLVVGEYYNQGQSGGTVGQGDTIAGYNRTYAQLRKAADPTVKIVMWTSLASKDRQGLTRDTFNTDLVNSPGAYIDAVIPVHTDTNIGIDGALGTSGSPTAVTNDGIHLNSTGTPYHAALVVPYVHL